MLSVGVSLYVINGIMYVNKLKPNIIQYETHCQKPSIKIIFNKYYNTIYDYNSSLDTDAN